MKNTFLHISKFLIIGLILNTLWLSAFSQLSKAEGESTVGGAISGAISTAKEATTDALKYANSDELTKAQADLVEAQKNLADAQEAENKASSALNAKKAEIEEQKNLFNEKGETQGKYTNEKKELEKKNPPTEDEKKRLKEINEQIESLKKEQNEIDTKISELENDIPNLKSDVEKASKKTKDAEQKVKEIEAKIKELEAALCLGSSDECEQMKHDADKAAQAAEQKAYDEAKSGECLKNCDTTYDTDKNIENYNTCMESCDTIINDFEERSRQILSAEQELYKYQTLKELTFDVESILNIDPMIVEEEKDTVQKKPYFSDTENTPIVSFILRVIDFAIRIIGSIAVLIIIIAGFILVVSVGNDTRIEQGKNAIKYAIIGLAIAFMSYTIVLFVQAIFSN